MLGTICPIRSTPDKPAYCQANCALYRTTQTGGNCALAAIANNLQELTATIKTVSETKNGNE